MSADVILCAPATFWRRLYGHCPTCGQRRRFISMEQVWYDAVHTCLGCGDAWSAEGRMQRPFRRGWRRDAIEWARARWVEGGDRKAFDLWWRQQMAAMDRA